MNRNRLVYIDNLRLVIIVLVVIQHLAVMYSGLSDWYYTENAQCGPGQTTFFLYWITFTQGYFMGLMFLLAGYFIPSSYDKKGFRDFLRDRAFRLGIPALIYIFGISPLILYVILGNRDFGGDNFIMYFLKNIIHFRFLNNMGPLWFAAALLFFSAIYALIRKFLTPRAKTAENTGFPGTVKIFALILLISVISFIARIYLPIGTKIISMRLGYFSQYVILFIVGIKCRRNNWLEKIDCFKGRIWLFSGLVLSFVFWIILADLGRMTRDNYSMFNGGLHWQSASYSLWESFAAVSMDIGLIALFKEKFNKQNSLVRAMSDNAFAVYVFHAPIIVWLALRIAPINAYPAVKFAALSLVSVPICFLFTNYIVRKISALRKVLA